MSTIVLSTVGNILLPGVGGFIGAAVGSYIDQNFLAPALFPADPIHGPRLSDLKFSSASEGDPSAIAFGIARVAGTVIYKGDLIQVKHEESAGKGGGGQTIVTYDYFVDLGVAFAMNELENFDALFADGKKVWGRSDDIVVDWISPDPSTDFIVNVLYDFNDDAGLDAATGLINDGSLAQGQTAINVDALNRDPVVDEVFNVEGDPTVYAVVSFTPSGAGAGALTFRPPSAQLWNDNDDLAFTGVLVADTYETIVSPTLAGGPDLSVFKSGADIEVTGFSLGENNGTFACVQSGIGGVGGVDTFVKLRNAGARPQTDDAARLSQSTPSFWAGLADDITLYYGTHTQLPDTFLESVKGVGEVPAYRGTAWILVERLKLGDFGNRIPNFEAIIREDGNRQMKDVFAALLERAGFTAADYDVSNLGAF